MAAPKLRLAVGGLLTAAGAAGCWLAYACRPPAHVRGGLAVPAVGRVEYLPEPYYQIVLTASAIVAAAGLALAILEWRSLS